MTLEPLELAPGVIGDPLPSEGEDAETADDTQDEFKARVDRLLEMIEEDPSVRDRMLAEMYTTIAEFQAQFAEMQSAMQEMGPRAMFKGLFGKKE